MKRILVIGSSSFIGTHLALHLNQTHEVRGTYFQHTNPALQENIPLSQLIIRENAPVEKILTAIEPEVVIYCPSITNFELCEKYPGMSYLINAETPQRLASTCQAMGMRYIHLSTSKVYQGSRGNYKESDTPKPQGVYGTTKYQGENFLREREDCFILRLATIYGLGFQSQNSLFNRIFLDLIQAKTAQFIDDEKRNFVWVKDVARLIERIIESPRSMSGTYNVSCEQSDTYFSFASKVAQTFGFDPKLVLPVPGSHFQRKGHSTQADRGQNLTLNSNKVHETFGVNLKSPQEALAELKSELLWGKQ